MSHETHAIDELRIDRSRARPAGGRGWVLLVLLLIIVLGGGAYWWFTRPKPVLVRTAAAQSVSSGGAQTLLNASGYVTARREATVSSKVTGKVVEVLVEEGMKVQEGQVLAKLDGSNVDIGYPKLFIRGRAEPAG